MPHVTVYTIMVDDQRKALAFYTDVLGFEPKDDITLGDGYRWCTVVHPKQPELNVNLAVPGPPLAPEMVEAIRRAQDEGGMNGLGLSVDDCQKTYEELAARGVEFTETPEDRPYGIDAGFRDPSGNSIRLTQVTIPSGV